VDAGRVPPLVQMIAGDELFQNPETAVDTYAQAWAWNYFLIKWRPKEYAAYLKAIAGKPLLAQDGRKARIAEFRKHFGTDLAKLEQEFYRQMERRVR
jgi:hypothetical protein